MKDCFKTIFILLSFFIITINFNFLNAAWLEDMVEKPIKRVEEKKKKEVEKIPVKKEEKPTPVVSEPEPKYEIPSQVTLIKVEKTALKNVSISWQGVEEKDITYNIYRSTNEPETEDELKIAEKIYSGLNTSYTDRNIDPGKYFYAVTVRDTKGNEDMNLVPDQSYYSIPVVIEEKKIPGSISGLTAVLTDKKFIKLNWEAQKEKSLFKIYRNIVPIKTVKDLSNSVILGSVKYPETSYIDYIVVPGAYYYTVTTENETGENSKIIPGTNSTINPVMSKKEEKKLAAKLVEEREKKIKETEEPKPVSEIKEPKKEKKPVRVSEYDLSRELSEIVRKDFYSGHYHTAIARLESVISLAKAEETKNRALLFIGKCYFNLKNYSKAVGIFAKLENIFPDESDFWIRRSLECLE